MAVLLLAGLASGCTKVTGGGWIVSASGPLEKASFGFNAKCRDRPGGAVLYEGQLEFKDPGAGVRIHGNVEPDEFVELAGVTCKEAGEVLVFPFATFRGSYRTQPPGGQGDFVVNVVDNGEPGALNGDTFEITLSGSLTYYNSGPIQGGNIQVH